MKPWLDCLSMGGYAGYVWPAYGLVCSVLVLILAAIKKQKKHTKLKLDEWFKSSQ
jgi:heme exporter protein D